MPYNHSPGRNVSPRLQERHLLQIFSGEVDQFRSIFHLSVTCHHEFKRQYQHLFIQTPSILSQASSSSHLSPPPPQTLPLLIPYTLIPPKELITQSRMVEPKPSLSSSSYSPSSLSSSSTLSVSSPSSLSSSSSSSTLEVSSPLRLMRGYAFSKPSNSALSYYYYRINHSSNRHRRHHNQRLVLSMAFIAMLLVRSCCALPMNRTNEPRLKSTNQNDHNFRIVTTDSSVSTESNIASNVINISHRSDITGNDIKLKDKIKIDSNGQIKFKSSSSLWKRHTSKPALDVNMKSTSYIADNLHENNYAGVSMEMLLAISTAVVTSVDNVVTVEYVDKVATTDFTSTINKTSDNNINNKNKNHNTNNQNNNQNNTNNHNDSHNNTNNQNNKHNNTNNQNNNHNNTNNHNDSQGNILLIIQTTHFHNLTKQELLEVISYLDHVKGQPEVKLVTYSIKEDENIINPDKLMTDVDDIIRLHDVAVVVAMTTGSIMDLIQTTTALSKTPLLGYDLHSKVRSSKDRAAFLFKSLNPSEGVLASALVRFLHLNSWFRFQIISDFSSDESFIDTLYRLTIGNKYNQFYHRNSVKSKVRPHNTHLGSRYKSNILGKNLGVISKLRGNYEEFLTEMRQNQEDENPHHKRHQRHLNLRLKRHLSHVKRETVSTSFFQHHRHHQHEHHNHNLSDSFLEPSDIISESDVIPNLDDFNRSSYSSSPHLPHHLHQNRHQPLNQSFLFDKVENLIKEELKKQESSSMWQLEDHVQLRHLSDSKITYLSIERRLQILKKSQSRVIVMHCNCQLAELVFRAAAKIGMLNGYAWMVTQHTISSDCKESQGFVPEWIPTGVMAVVTKDWSSMNMRRGHTSGNQHQSNEQERWQLIRRQPSMTAISEALKLSSRSIRARHAFGHGSLASELNLKPSKTLQFAVPSINVSIQAINEQLADGQIPTNNCLNYEHELNQNDDDDEEDATFWSDSTENRAYFEKGINPIKRRRDMIPLTSGEDGSIELDGVEILNLVEHNYDDDDDDDGDDDYGDDETYLLRGSKHSIYYYDNRRYRGNGDDERGRFLDYENPEINSNDDEDDEDDKDKYDKDKIRKRKTTEDHPRTIASILVHHQESNTDLYSEQKNMTTNHRQRSSKMFGSFLKQYYKTDSYLFSSTSNTNNIDNKRVENSKGKIWKLIGWFRNGNVKFSTIVWPGKSFEGPDRNGQRVLRVVTMATDPFVMEQSDMGACPTSTPCLRISSTIDEKVKKVKKDILKRLKFNGARSVNGVSSSGVENLEKDVFKYETSMENEDRRIMLEQIFEDFEKNNDMKLNLESKYSVSCCHGLSIMLLNKLAKDLNFRLQIYFVGDSQFGHQEPPDMKWGGIVRDLSTGLAHAAVAAFSATRLRSDEIDFTYPYFYSGFSILVSEKKRSTPIYAFMEPFDGWVWISIVCSATVVAVALSLLEWNSPFGLNPWGRRRKTNYTLGSGLNMVYAILFQHTIKTKSPKAWPSKWLQNFWAGASIFIYSSYTANLAAFLAGKNSGVVISGLDDPRLLEPDTRIGLTKGTAVEEFTARVNPKLLLRAQRYPANMSLENVVALLQNDIIDAFLGDTPILEYARTTLDYKCQLKLVGRGFGEDSYAIGVPKNSWLRDEISAKILDYQESGYLDDLTALYFSGSKCSDNPNHNQLQGEAAPMNLDQHAGLYLLLVAGVLVCVLLILVEHATFKWLVPYWRSKPSVSFWKSFSMMFWSQRLYRIITSEQLVSPHHSAREMIEVVRKRDFAKLFQKSVRRQETRARNRRNLFNVVEQLRWKNRSLESAHLQQSASMTMTTPTTLTSSCLPQADGNNNESTKNMSDSNIQLGGYSSEPELIRSISFIATDADSFAAGTFSRTSDEDDEYDDDEKMELDRQDQSADELLSTCESTSKLIDNISQTRSKTYKDQRICFHDNRKEYDEQGEGLRFVAKRKIFSTRSVAVPSHRAMFGHHHRPALKTISDIGSEPDTRGLNTISSSTLFLSSGVAATPTDVDSVATNCRITTGLHVAPSRPPCHPPVIPFKRGLELTARGVPNGLVFFSSLRNKNVFTDSLLMPRRRSNENGLTKEIEKSKIKIRSGNKISKPRQDELHRISSNLNNTSFLSELNLALTRKSCGPSFHRELQTTDENWQSNRMRMNVRSTSSSPSLSPKISATSFTPLLRPCNDWQQQQNNIRHPGMRVKLSHLEGSRFEDGEKHYVRHNQSKPTPEAGDAIKTRSSGQSQLLADKIGWSAGLCTTPKPRVKGMKSCPYVSKELGGPPVLDGLSKGQLFALWKASEKTLNARLKEAVKENQELRFQIEALGDKGHQ